MLPSAIKGFLRVVHDGKGTVLSYIASILTINGARMCLAAGQGGWDFHCDCYEGTGFVTNSAGDAIQVNKHIQTITPRPPYVQNRTPDFDGHRAVIAIGRYQRNAAIPPGPLSAQMMCEQNGNSSVPPLPGEPGN
jgi:hypothetical protein